ncbi:hypothetical protein AE921_06480 [Xanthomonas arboricola]|nr:hypothetical protein AE921_06480 [Xanthomonas arboricola]KOB06452.1 hypothetical protein AE923_15635 [Xanthomonas arboricola]KOB07955.1 hypothetical protein AE922_12320 [Xanthomonas arboricola]KOB24408.1 hypothetical protein AE926_06845 [Xanthomonas arboricola]KOB30039.1 hypothetical protein AE927_00005 [Xanthomonas arboricola]
MTGRPWPAEPQQLGSQIERVLDVLHFLRGKARSALLKEVAEQATGDLDVRLVMHGCSCVG